MSPAELARLIDHTLLKPKATRGDIERLCDEALQYEFATVCVNACYVAQAAEALRGSRVCVCAVVGFPLGATLTSVKVFEATEAMRLGAKMGVKASGGIRSLQASQEMLAAGATRIGTSSSVKIMQELAASISGKP